MIVGFGIGLIVYYMVEEIGCCMCEEGLCIIGVIILNVIKE